MKYVDETNGAGWKALTARERDVILQEIGQALDTPDDLIFDQFQETALPGQPLGRPVLGTAESVEAIGRDDLFAYLARHYTAGNMVLSAAGRVEHDQIVDLAEKHFGSVPRTPANADKPVPLAYVGGDGMIGDDLVTGLPPDAVNGKIIATRAGAYAGESADVYKKLATDAGQDPAATYAPQAYDAGFLLALAVQKNGSADRAGLAAALREVASAPGEKILPGEWAKAKNEKARADDETDEEDIAQDLGHGRHLGQSLRFGQSSEADDMLVPGDGAPPVEEIAAVGGDGKALWRGGNARRIRQYRLRNQPPVLAIEHGPQPVLR